MVEAPVKSGLASTNNSISNSADNVKNSLKEDSLGNKLFDEQVEYFKDSKVRDEKGQLIPVYQFYCNIIAVFYVIASLNVTYVH